MYKLLQNSTFIIRISDGTTIPTDTDNTDYATYLAWLSEGNTPEPADPPSPPPVYPITRRQLLIALKTTGIISSAEAIAAAQSGAVPTAVQAVFDTLPSQDDKDSATITWASMSVAERTNPLVALLAAAHDMSEAVTDEFFRSASRI